MSRHSDPGVVTGSNAWRPRRCVVLPETRRLLVDGADVRLGGRAFDLLWALLERRGSVVPKQYLHDVIWPGVCVTPNNLDVQIWALRRGLGQDAISTVPRQGYMLTDAVEFAVVGSSSLASQVQATGSAVSGSDPVELLAESLTRRLKKMGQLTLVGADPSARRLVCAAMCNAYLRLGGGAIWHIQARESAGLVQHEKTIDRMKRVGGLVVVMEGDAFLRGTVNEWTRTAEGGSHALSCLTTAAEAVSGVDRHAHAVPPLRSSGGLARSERPARSHLRWQSRGPNDPR